MNLEIVMKLLGLILTAAFALALSACYTAPIRPSGLDDARVAVDSARADPQVMTYAPDELQLAIATYGYAESMLRREGDTDRVRHAAYLARERAEFAQEMARLRFAEGAAGRAMAEGERPGPAARPRELEGTPRSAQLAQAEARAESARRAALEAEMQARVEQQQALTAQQRARSPSERSGMLERELRQLAATKSDRGTVITLNDVLFDPGSALLRPGGQRLVARLAGLLREYPERTIAIEGFSDSSGADAQNLALSEQRATAVRLALIDAGVDASRVFVRGYGHAYPVASNETAEGRQRNRRVEVVISDERGAIGPRMATYNGR